MRMKLGKKSLKIIKEAAERIDPPRGVEIRFVKSQKKGWGAITRGDRDWDAGISEDEMMNNLINEAEHRMVMQDFEASK